MALIDSIIGGELNGSVGDDPPPSPCRDDPPNPSIRSTDDDDTNENNDTDEYDDCLSPNSRNSKQPYRLSELELKNTLG